MATYLLDTDICVFLLKDKYKIKEKIQIVGISNCFLSEITIAELTYGAYKSNQYHKHLREVKRLKSLFSTIPIRGSFNKYGEEKARLTALGTPISDFDLLIGITSTFRNMIMVTNNEKHYTRIKGIKIENWTKTPVK